MPRLTVRLPDELRFESDVADGVGTATGAERAEAAEPMRHRPSVERWLACWADAEDY